MLLVSLDPFYQIWVEHLPKVDIPFGPEGIRFRLWRCVKETNMHFLITIRNYQMNFLQTYTYIYYSIYGNMTQYVGKIIDS